MKFDNKIWIKIDSLSTRFTVKSSNLPWRKRHGIGFVKQNFKILIVEVNSILISNIKLSHIVFTNNCILVKINFHYVFKKNLYFHLLFYNS